MDIPPPPPQFDYLPLPVPIYRMISPWTMLDRFGPYLGYTRFEGGRCVIYLVDTVVDRTQRAALVRHENGHCNGWRHGV